MHAAEVVVREMQSDSGFQMRYFLAERRRFKLAAVLALPSNLALMTKDAGLKCGPYLLLCPLAIRAKKVA